MKKIKQLIYDLKMLYSLLKRKRKTKERWGQLIINISDENGTSYSSNMFYDDTYLHIAIDNY
mgnify:CR=1 FL=1